MCALVKEWDIFHHYLVPEIYHNKKIATMFVKINSTSMCYKKTA